MKMEYLTCKSNTMGTVIK